MHLLNGNDAVFLSLLVATFLLRGWAWALECAVKAIDGGFSHCRWPVIRSLLALLSVPMMVKVTITGVGLIHRLLS